MHQDALRASRHPHIKQRHRMLAFYVEASTNSDIPLCTWIAIESEMHF